MSVYTLIVDRDVAINRLAERLEMITILKLHFNYKNLDKTAGVQADHNQKLISYFINLQGLKLQRALNPAG